MKLKDFGIIVRTIGIICLLLLLIQKKVTIPLYVIALITIGYLSSAISCNVALFSPSVEHHKIVHYFIAFLGIIVILQHYSVL